MHPSASVRVHTYLCTSASYVYVCAYMCVCQYAYVRTYVCAYTCVCERAYVQICVCYVGVLHACALMWVFMLHMCLLMYVCSRVCADVRVLICVCADVCVWLTHPHTNKQSLQCS